MQLRLSVRGATDPGALHNGRRVGVFAHSGYGGPVGGPHRVQHRSRSFAGCTVVGAASADPRVPQGVSTASRGWRASLLERSTKLPRASPHAAMHVACAADLAASAVKPSRSLTWTRPSTRSTWASRSTSPGISATAFSSCSSVCQTSTAAEDVHLSTIALGEHHDRRRWLGWRRWGSPGWRRVAVIGWRWRQPPITFAPHARRWMGRRAPRRHFARHGGRPARRCRGPIHEASELVGAESPLMPWFDYQAGALAHLRGSPAHFSPTPTSRFTRRVPTLGASTAERP